MKIRKVGGKMRFAKVTDSCMSNILASGAFLAIALELASKTRRDKTRRDKTRSRSCSRFCFLLEDETRRDKTRHTLALALVPALADYHRLTLPCVLGARMKVGDAGVPIN